MTATIPPVVDDPIVTIVAYAIARQNLNEWGHVDIQLDGWLAAEALRVTPIVRQAIAALQEMGRLLPEGVTRREVHSQFDGTNRKLVGEANRYMGPSPVLGPSWWVEVHTVWETTPARPEATT